MNAGAAAGSVFTSTQGERAVMRLYDSVLERWPVEYQILEIPTRHGRAFAIASGDASAPPIILLHGAGTNSTMWVGEISAYSRQHRVYLVDIPGEAGRSAPIRLPLDSPAYSEWLGDVLLHLGVGKSAIVGFSQGGWVALRYAISNPERISKLALVCPGGIIPDKLMFAVRALPLMMLGSWGARQIVRMLYGGRPVPDGVTEAMTVIMRHFRQRIEILPLFSDEELSRLSMPVLLVAGMRDPLRNAKRIAERMRGFVPSLSTDLVREGGHALSNTVASILPFLAAGT